ncbi:MAG: hypothetical protein WD690_08500 [Vicinamibacterales bacterium]
MRHAHLAILPFLLLVAIPASVRPSAQSSAVVSQLDRYQRGEHDAVVSELEGIEDLGGYDALLEALRREVPSWLAAAPDAERAKRRLAAATFALEAARAADHVDWKWLRRLTAQGNENQEADSIFWKAPPLLIEWGCALLRTEPAPRPIERIWHLAAVAVAQRTGDFEFLIGSPWDARMNAPDEIAHIYHATARFKNEPRFRLSIAIALDWQTWTRSRGSVAPRQADAAADAFEKALRDDAIGGEAAVRLGALQARRRRVKDALETFARAETLTRDRYLVYLARYFQGQAHEAAKQPVEAEAAYRRALATIPHAQSATLALGALLAKQGRRSEAGGLVEAQLSTSPQPVDPWLTYGAADDRFWPELIAQLRAEIRN